MSNEYGPERAEPLDVVLVKDSVNVVSAKPDDFRRVAVTAQDPSVAVFLEPVQAVVKEGYRIVQVANPGRLTDVEQAARARQHEAEYGLPLDRTKV